MLLAKAGPAFFAGLGSFGSANTAHTKNPAGAGFFGAADPQGSGGLLQRLDAGGVLLADHHRRGIMQLVCFEPL